MSRHTQRRKNAYKELVKVLGWSKSDRPLSYTEPDNVPEIVLEPELEPKAKFQEGHVYMIKTKHSRAWDIDCLFRYEGKQGIHYVFRETRGGWMRTYTDAQLIGKEIKEQEDK